MTTVISILGIVGRAIGKVLASSLGWATTLLYGRVPSGHQKFVEGMLAASVVWAALVVLTLVPPVFAFVLATTPFVPSLGLAILRTAMLAGLILLPAVVGLLGVLVPARDRRARGAAILVGIARGYPLAVLLAAMAVFLPLAGFARRVGSVRRGWADLHIPMIVRPGGYDPLLGKLESTLRRQGFDLQRRDAPRILDVPGRVLALIAGRDVADLLPERMVELRSDTLEVGVYPSDIVISGPVPDRLQARAAVMATLASTTVHLTTSAESQRVEDRLEVIARAATPAIDALAEMAAVDGELARLDIPPEDWEILYRLRLQAERDVLRRSESRA